MSAAESKYFNIDVSKLSRDEKEEGLNGDFGNIHNWLYTLNSRLIQDEANRIARGKSPLEYVDAAANFVSNLMVGNWSKDFSGGNPPGFWQSTHQVFEKHAECQSSVKYGQCWCYAEVMVSMCRAVGIPSRSVCARNSRYDKGNDGGIDVGIVPHKGEGFSYVPINIDDSIHDMIYADKGDEDEIEVVPPVQEQAAAASAEPFDLSTLDVATLVDSGDSVWNFHVWAEVYVDGQWYAVDATPLEGEAPKHGPTRIHAVRDAIFAEPDYKYFNSAVNGIYRFWQTETLANSVTITYPKTIDMSCLTNLGDSHRVIVSTKTPGSRNGFVEVTDDYKVDPSLVEPHYYAEFPFVLAKDHGRIVAEIRPAHARGHYYTQICLLNANGNIINYRRKIVSDLAHEIKIPKNNGSGVAYSIVTVLIGDKEHKWWAQVLKI